MQLTMTLSSCSNDYTISKILESLKRDRALAIGSQEHVFEENENEELNSEEVVKKKNPMAQKHNICAFLGESSRYPQFGDMIRFLRRSRIFYAISTRYDAYRSHQALFWDTAVLDDSMTPKVIRGRINHQDFVISEETIRATLHLNDNAKDPTTLDGRLLKGCLLRMKYDDDTTESMIIKANFPKQFKYLMHVIIHCLGPRKSGYDAARDTLVSAMVALVLNKPFNFSGMIFLHLSENLGRKLKRNEKFNMYPRFLQMMFDAQHPDLPKADADKFIFDHMTEATLSRMTSYRSKDAVPDRRLFGHLLNEEYQAPKEDKWCHDNSDSDVEDVGDDNDDDGDDEEENHETEQGKGDQEDDNSDDDDDEGNYESSTIQTASKRKVTQSHVPSHGEGSSSPAGDVYPDFVPPSKRQKQTAAEKPKKKMSKRVLLVENPDPTEPNAGDGMNTTNGWICESDNSRYTSSVFPALSPAVNHQPAALEDPGTSDGLWRGNAVGQPVKQILQAVEDRYPDTFQGLQISPKPYWLSTMKELHDFIKGFLETSVHALEEDQLTSLEADLNFFERIGFNLSWARNRLHMVKSFKFGNDPLRLEFVEVNARFEKARLEYDSATDARNKKLHEVAQKFGAEYDSVLNGDLGFGLLPRY